LVFIFAMGKVDVVEEVGKERLYPSACDAKEQHNIKREGCSTLRDRLIGSKHIDLDGRRSPMFERQVIFVLALSLGAYGSANSAAAQETGLAEMHSSVRVAGRTCLLDHFHDGSGSGSTRAAAQRAAIGAWRDFTAFEYGGRWGSWQAAASKRVGCSGGPGNFNCSVAGRPCRS
jgi:hypothetical protein